MAHPDYPDMAGYPSLANQLVFISGGASGIGASLVAHFAAQGSRVFFCDLDEAAAKSLIAGLAGMRHAPVFSPCDIRDVKAYQSLLADIERDAGAFGVLVNNAGNDRRHTLAELTLESWDETLAVNLRHHVFAIQQVAPGMAKAGGGSIINLGSVAWMRGRAELTGYVAAKAAISGMTRSLARELGDANIRVNALVPGAVVTPRQQALWRDPEADRRFIEYQCLKFRLDPHHVARAALFLASSESAAMTGQNLIIDAGLAQVSVAG